MSGQAAVAQCLGKHAYDTFEAANRCRPLRAGKVVAYHCPSCSMWHLGSENVLGKKGKKGAGFRRSHRRAIR